MQILDNAYVEIVFKEEKQLGMISWKIKTTSDEYRNAFLTLLDFQKNKTITRYISDIRKQGIISPDDRKWFEQVAMPKAIEQGLKYVAVVFDGNVFKKYYLNVILAAVNKYGVPMKLFSTIESAEEWLMTK